MNKGFFKLLILLRNSLFLNNQKSIIRATIEVKKSAIKILSDNAKGISNTKIKTVFSRKISLLKLLIILFIILYFILPFY